MPLALSYNLMDKDISLIQLTWLTIWVEILG